MLTLVEIGNFNVPDDNKLAPFHLSWMGTMLRQKKVSYIVWGVAADSHLVFILS